MEYLNNSIRGFSPAWFASVMGTGILAITSKFYADFIPLLQDVSVVLGAINMVLFLVLIIPWIWRWFGYKEQALADLHAPVIGQFYATMPIACLVLAADLLVIGPDYLGLTVSLELARWFWGIGVILAIIMAVTIPILYFINPDIKKEALNPAWFMPPVSLIVVPVAGAKLIPYWPFELQVPLLIINLISWSCGFFLYLMLSTACFYRFICCSPLPGFLAPTMWINLGPIGVGTIALLNLAPVSTFYFGNVMAGVINMFGLIFWGFGFWWLIMALFTTVWYFRKNNLPYAMSWWAFTFPLGAYTGATYLIADIFNISVIKYYGFACYWLLFIFWFIVVIKTFVHIKEILNA
ncbi:tellurite-resistance/dicarboxylate transporter [Desulfolucanica intricata]|uniref:tellurite-resistance/dicarboxylate transporter n=1 Tax=Desulfolucanica intricata TaxID=1285191 RepID=UPI00082C1AC8|nr:tellurite-resistance/dicarboxylate transporter [Desulfolucanica intricata]